MNQAEASRRIEQLEEDIYKIERELEAIRKGIIKLNSLVGGALYLAEQADAKSNPAKIELEYTPPSPAQKRRLFHSAKDSANIAGK